MKDKGPGLIKFSPQVELAFRAYWPLSPLASWTFPKIDHPNEPFETLDRFLISGGPFKGKLILQLNLKISFMSRNDILYCQQ